MTKRTLFTLALCNALALASAPVDASAQHISLEVRGSLQQTVGDFGDSADGEAGFGGAVMVNLNPSFSLYGGYSMEMFGCDGCGDDDGSTSRGFEAGGKFLLSRGEGGVLPWLKGGLVFHELEVESSGSSATSDMGLGFQAAAGVDIPLGEVLSFSPAVRYQRSNAEFDVVGDALVVQGDVSFVALDLALHIHPGS